MEIVFYDHWTLNASDLSALTRPSTSPRTTFPAPRENLVRIHVLESRIPQTKPRRIIAGFYSHH